MANPAPPRNSSRSSTRNCENSPPHGWPEKPGQTLQPTALVHEAYLRYRSAERPNPGTAAVTSSPPPPRPCGASSSIKLATSRAETAGGDRQRIDANLISSSLGTSTDDLLRSRRSLAGSASRSAAGRTGQTPLLRRPDHRRSRRIWASRRHRRAHWAYAAWLLRQLTGMPTNDRIASIKKFLRIS